MYAPLLRSKTPPTKSIQDRTLKKSDGDVPVMIEL